MIEVLYQCFEVINNEILLFILTVCVCIIPLILIWRSTEVSQRTYNQYVVEPNIPPHMQNSDIVDVFTTTTDNLVDELEPDVTDNENLSNEEIDSSRETSANVSTELLDETTSNETTAILESGNALSEGGENSFEESASIYSVQLTETTSNTVTTTVESRDILKQGDESIHEPSVNDCTEQINESSSTTNATALVEKKDTSSKEENSDEILVRASPKLEESSTVAAAQVENTLSNQNESSHEASNIAMKQSNVNNTTTNESSQATVKDTVVDESVESVPEQSQTSDTSFVLELPEIIPGHFLVRLKFLDDTVRYIQAKPTETLGEFRRKCFPVSTADRYRIIYRGQVLRNNEQTMEQCGIYNASASVHDVPVIHCFLSLESSSRNLPTSASSQLQHSMEELNIGHFFLPMLGSFITLLWYLCIYHTSLFTIPSIFGVIGLSCFYLVLIVNRFF